MTKTKTGHFLGRAVVQVVTTKDVNELLNIPNTTKLLDRGVFYALDWILVEDGADVISEHLRISIKAIGIISDTKKVWHYTDYAHDLDIAYLGISKIFELSMKHTKKSNPDLNEIYMLGIDAFDDWYKKNRLSEKINITSFYFDVSQ